jgi:diaminopimelate decarboxylase
MMQLSWVDFDRLEQEYGESFFIVDICQFKQNYTEFIQAFRSIYANTNLGYSYKTNYLPKLCQTAAELGGYAEVVSQMEYDLAIAIGVPPHRIIFNGPLKHQADLEAAILAGAIVNLDSLEEVEIVAALAKRLPAQQIAVGLRCNFNLGDDRISRFGLDVEAGDLDRVFQKFGELPNCQVDGLHCHFTTAARSIESYALRTKKILEISDRYFPDQPPKFIDVGGGFFGKMTADLQEQFDCHIPNYQEYATAIATQLQTRFPDANSRPELIIEPGVAIIADVLIFACKVVGLKTVRSRQIALVVGSFQNVKPTMTDKNLAIEVYRNMKNTQQRKLSGTIDIVGYTCMETDCLYKDYQGEVGIGDYIVFENMGAYTIVFKQPFIRPNPPIISYDSNLDEYSLVRRTETAKDIFATYVI